MFGDGCGVCAVWILYSDRFGGAEKYCEPHAETSTDDASVGTNRILIMNCVGCTGLVLRECARDVTFCSRASIASEDVIKTAEMRLPWDP